MSVKPEGLNKLATLHKYIGKVNDSVAQTLLQLNPNKTEIVVFGPNNLAFFRVLKIILFQKPILYLFIYFSHLAFHHQNFRDVPERIIHTLISL